ISVAITIHVLEYAFLPELIDQVLIKGHLKFCRKRYPIRPDHHHPDCRRSRLRLLIFLRAQERACKKDREHYRKNRWVSQVEFHGFYSFRSDAGFFVCAPCAISS